MPDDFGHPASHRLPPQAAAITVSTCSAGGGGRQRLGLAWLRAQSAQHDREVAPPQVGRCIVAEQRREHQLEQRQVLGLYVCSERARFLGAGDQPGTDRLQARAGPRQALKAAGGAEEQFAQTTVLSLEREVGIEEVGQAVPRIRVLDRLLQERRDLLDPLLEQAVDQLLTVGEVAVHRLRLRRRRNARCR